MVWEHGHLSQSWGGGSVSKDLFLETGVMTFYVLQGLRIKSKWKEASSTQTVWKAFIFAGNLA